MIKRVLLQMLALIAVVLLSACSTDNKGSSNNDVSTNQTATVLAYFPVTNLETKEYYTLKNDNNTAESIGSPNKFILNMMNNINDENTKIYVMAGAGNIIHDETVNPDAVNYPVKDFTKNYQYKITRNKIELLNQDTAEVSCYTGANPVNPAAADINSCKDMGDVEVISDFLVKGINENKTDKYVAVFYIHGGGSIVGMGFTDYMEMINAEKFGKVFERVREKLGNPDFKFDTIIMISCLMGNAAFMHTVKDYADYYIGSESSQPIISWDLTKYIQEIGKGYDSQRAGQVILDTYKERIEKYSLSSDINMIDLNKMSAVSNAFDNLSKALKINYDKGGIDKIKTINNVFLSAYNSIYYSHGQFDISAFAERLGIKDEYYTDDYTAVKNELQTVVKDALINKFSRGMYISNGGMSFSVNPSLYAMGEQDGYTFGNISFSPDYRAFMKQISNDLVKMSQEAYITVNSSYDNGLVYTITSPVAITNAQIDIGSFDAANPANDRVGSLTNILVPEPQLDETSNTYIYTLNFGNPEEGYIFTLNDNPIRVERIGLYSPEKNVLYFRTTDTYCISDNGYESECSLIFSYNVDTNEAEFNQVRTSKTFMNDMDIIKNYSKIVIEPYESTDNAYTKTTVIPSYEIQIDRSAENGGLYLSGAQYSILEGKTAQYRLAYGTVFDIGTDNINYSPWKTLDEIKGNAAQQ